MNGYTMEAQQVTTPIMTVANKLLIEDDEQISRLTSRRLCLAVHMREGYFK